MINLIVSFMEKLKAAHDWLSPSESQTVQSLWKPQVEDTGGKPISQANLLAAKGLAKLKAYYAANGAQGIAH